MKMSVTLNDLIAQSGVRNIDEKCTDEDILAFGEFCDPWNEVGLYLGLDRSQLSAIDGDSRTVSLKRLGVLQKWKEAFVFKATYRKLVEALLKCNKADTAFKVCEIVAQKQGKLRHDVYVQDDICTVHINTMHLAFQVVHFKIMHGVYHIV